MDAALWLYDTFTFSEHNGSLFHLYLNLRFLRQYVKHLVLFHTAFLKNGKNSTVAKITLYYVYRIFILP